LRVIVDVAERNFSTRGCRGDLPSKGRRAPRQIREIGDGRRPPVFQQFQGKPNLWTPYRSPGVIDEQFAETLQNELEHVHLSVFLKTLVRFDSDPISE